MLLRLGSRAADAPHAAPARERLAPKYLAIRLRSPLLSPACERGIIDPLGLAKAKGAGPSPACIALRRRDGACGAGATPPRLRSRRRSSRHGGQ